MHGLPKGIFYLKITLKGMQSLLEHLNFTYNDQGFFFGGGVGLGVILLIVASLIGSLDTNWIMFRKQQLLSTKYFLIQFQMAGQHGFREYPQGHCYVQYWPVNWKYQVYLRDNRILELFSLWSLLSWSKIPQNSWKLNK